MNMSASLPSYVESTIPRGHRSLADRARCVLDDALDRVRRGDARRATALLVEALDGLYHQADEPARAELRELCRAHGLFTLLAEDPYTARARNKPRGYAGDAVMLDFIYARSAPAQTSQVGREVFAVTTGCSTAQSVSLRRDLLGALIDRAAHRRARPNILAVAAGHLREAAGSSALAQRRVGRFTALDQDAESLAVVDAEYGHLGVEVVRESVGGLLKGRYAPAELDLAYVAGLLDYLDDDSAAKLIARLFGALRPGGSLLVANFAPKHTAEGYMACFMEWRLVQRDVYALQLLAKDLPDAEVASLRAFRDTPGNVAYLEIVRA